MLTGCLSDRAGPLARRGNMSIHIHRRKETTLSAGQGARQTSDGWAPQDLRVWRNARLATMNPKMPGLGIVEHGAVAVDGDGVIAFAGPEAEMDAGLTEYAEGGARFTIRDSIDCEGRLVTPGLIDCHTHLVHAGSRANEWEMRLAGASYEAVARSGGGIVSSVKALRAASVDELIAQSLPRLDALIAEGVTTVEVKSGYGLDLPNELKSLEAIGALTDHRDIRVQPTFLAAHALPPEAGGDSHAYIETVVEEVLPAVKAQGIAEAVDAFCETIAFSADEVGRVFGKAIELRMPVKLHADQLSDGGGAALAARFGALSADHLEHCSEEGARAMAAAGTVAVMLPGAFYFIRETKVPPVELFRRHAVPMAVATDCNPGTAPLSSLLLAANMAATLFGMTAEECLLGMTRNAAAALGLPGTRGMLQAGMEADMAIWDAERPAELIYRMGSSPLHRRVRAGR
jgi:imidazolonepropionase